MFCFHCRLNGLVILILSIFSLYLGFPGGSVAKKNCLQYGRCKKCRFDPRVRKIPWRRKWQPTAVFLPGKFHGQRSLVGYSPWGHKELDMTK